MFWRIIDPNTTTVFVRFIGDTVITDVSILYWIFVLIGLLMSISVHEFAHAYAAYSLGDDTAKRQGRMNINPLNHFDFLGLGLILFTFFGYGKPVPVDPYNFKNPAKGFTFVSLAGPISNLLIAFASGVVFLILKHFADINGDLNSLSGILTGIVSTFVYTLPLIGVINISLAIFNLLPFYPLDGSKVWAYISPKIDDFIKYYITPYSIYLLILLILPIWDGISILQFLTLPFTVVYLLILNSF